MLRVAFASARRGFHASASAAHHVSLVRQPFPAFSATAVMPDGSFAKLSNASFKGSWSVLFFYPLDFTFVCPTEIIAFSDRVGEFERLGVKVAAASIDSEHCHLAWTATPRSKGGLGKMAIPLIADPSRALSKSCGVLIDHEGDADSGIAFRGTFVIDPAGIVRSVQINDLPVGRSVDEVLRIVQAFQHHAKVGDVCPAGWTPGKATMKADHKGAAAYFSKVPEMK